jgi:hypothetical protein
MASIASGLAGGGFGMIFGTNGKKLSSAIAACGGRTPADDQKHKD